MFRLLHLSDTHLRAPGVDGEPFGIAPSPRLETVLRAVVDTGFAPDLIVHTGDIADDESAHAVTRVHDRLSTIAPTIAVPGNHDDPVAVRRVFGPPEAQAGPWRVVGVDTCIPGKVEGRSPDVPALVRGADGPTILLMHHPIRSTSLHPWFRVGGGRQAEAALEGSPHPWIVLSGHTHEVYEERIGAEGHVRLWGGPATFYALRHRDDTWQMTAGGTGARLIELDDDPRVVRSRVVSA